MSKRLSPDAVAILATMDIEGNIARITAGQLSRDLYVEVNRFLGIQGGKWNRKLRGHVFTGDPRPAIERAIRDRGEFEDPKSKYGVFETPPEIATAVVQAAGIRPGYRVLEPSAGRGALLRALAMHIPTKKIKLTAIELLDDNYQILVADGWGNHVVKMDFLLYTGGPFDVVIMNPPFGKQADIHHVLHAYELLAPGGRLVAIMGAGMRFRKNKKTNALRELIAECGEIEDLPDHAFHESGTDVSTVLVTLERERHAFASRHSQSAGEGEKSPRPAPTPFRRKAQWTIDALPQTSDWLGSRLWAGPSRSRWLDVA